MKLMFMCCDCNRLWLVYHEECPSCGGLVIEKEIKHLGDQLKEDI